MNEVALKKQIENLEAELKVLEDYLKTELMNLRADTDQLNWKSPPAAESWSKNYRILGKNI